MWKVVELGKFKGLPIYWKSQNNKCIIVYNQFSMGKKFTLYLEGRYIESSDFMEELIRIANKSYYYRR